ncbi:MAG: TIGR01212 family radical SAM protein [Gudongella sp.]|nr:TIGR01212 family radical SAM protein [Gudongella sp.]
MNDGKRYNTLNSEMIKIFGKKTIKLSLDGGFSCPNRDGTIGDRGCIFCGERGSGEFTNFNLCLSSQADEQIKLISKKWDTDKYIAYFQSFTNTYAPIEKLEDLYTQALEIPGVVGIAIATRPDCLSEEILDYLELLNRKTFLWVELGLQTIHENTAKLIRRGYELDVYDDAVSQLKLRDIRVVTHAIIGLPYETKEEILKTCDYIAHKKLWGIKLHSLYIQKDTDLYDFYLNNPFKIMSKEEYIDIITEIIRILPKELVIHRLTGDGDKSLLFEPVWSKNKLGVLSSIDKALKEKNIYQGDQWKL